MTETVDMGRDRLPAPRDVGAAPRVLVAELRGLVGERAVVDICAALLAGAPPEEHVDALWFFAGRAARGVLEGGWAPYWVRVWGARGLLYAWDPTVAPRIVEGLGDEHWRVAEMCLKVSTLRDLAEAGDPALPLLHHALPRVRATAVRTLGVVGDTEHVSAVEEAVDDPEPSVRRAAALALRRLEGRLDLPPSRTSGRD